MWTFLSGSLFDVSQLDDVTLFFAYDFKSKRFSMPRTCFASKLKVSTVKKKKNFVHFMSFWFFILTTTTTTATETETSRKSSRLTSFFHSTFSFFNESRMGRKRGSGSIIVVVVCKNFRFYFTPTFTGLAFAYDEDDYSLFFFLSYQTFFPELFLLSRRLVNVSLSFFYFPLSLSLF